MNQKLLKYPVFGDHDVVLMVCRYRYMNQTKYIGMNVSHEVNDYTENNDADGEIGYKNYVF